MNIATIEELAYAIKKAKEGGASPIFFLGAGASKSGGIPLASEVVTDILEGFEDSPRVKKLADTGSTSYPKLMACLEALQRNELLKGYIDKAKVNVTHIYLAQLLAKGYVDYVLTVNFDNLMLRALALFNIFPSTYDMAILKELTTTAFKEKSVVYLHGQHHGPWLLNTDSEMKKVNATAPRIINNIASGRPWVFIGYSGDDPIFEHIKKLGRFDNGLYWVTHNDSDPNSKVTALLNDENSGSFLIKGYDSDSFMLKLNNELGLGQPEIIDKPFTSLQKMLENVVDIDDKDHFKGVKERLKIAKAQVAQAITQFEKGTPPDNQVSQNKSKIDGLKKEIIALIISEKYDEVRVSKINIEAKQLEDNELNNLIAEFYFNWGNSLGSLAGTKEGQEAEELYQQAFDKYQKAVEIKPDKHEAFYNWGTYLGRLAGTKEGQEAEELYQQAFDKYQKAVEIKPDKHDAFNNWGTYLGRLARTKEGQEAEELYLQAFDKYQKAVEIKPDKHEAFNNWGNSLGRLAGTKEGQEAEKLYQQAFDKYQKAVEIKPDKHDAFNNWGNYLGSFAGTKEGQEAEELYLQAIDKCQKAIELGASSYNLSCIYALQGEKDKALKQLHICLSKGEVAVDFVRSDDDWKDYQDDEDFNDLVRAY